MIFGVNTSPMAGRDGQYVTSRNLRDRLARELLGNVSIRVEDTDSPDQIKVVGRGELQLSILIEMMRREGYELQVSRPEIVTREVDGRTMEPVEELVIDVAEEFQGVVIAQLGTQARHDDEDGQPRERAGPPRVPHPDARPDWLPVAVPHRHAGHRHHEPPVRRVGAVARPDCRPVDGRPRRRSARAGDRLRHVQPAGAGRDLHRSRDGGLRGDDHRRERPRADLDVNVTKEKKQTNMRASTADEAIRLVPPRKLNLEQAIEFINDDELVEVTPASVRLRKKILAANRRPKPRAGI